MTTSADKRSVSTDALETLGTILTTPQKRDAIHLAVIPVVAATTLKAGESIKLFKNDTKLYKKGEAIYDENGIGIVDPFIETGYVEKGESFWMVIKPRLITSLRHVWSHPDFEDEPETEQKQDYKLCYNTAKTILQKDPNVLLTYLILQVMNKVGNDVYSHLGTKDCWDIVGKSEKWLQKYSNDWDHPDLDAIIEATNGIGNWRGEDYLHIDGTDASGDIDPELWIHLKNARGIDIAEPPKYFSCAC